MFNINNKIIRTFSQFIRTKEQHWWIKIPRKINP